LLLKSLLSFNVLDLSILLATSVSGKTLLASFAYLVFHNQIPSITSITTTIERLTPNIIAREFVAVAVLYLIGTTYNVNSVKWVDWHVNDILGVSLPTYDGLVVTLYDDQSLVVVFQY